MRRPAIARAAKANGKVRLAPIHDLVGRTREIQDLIAQRAHQLYKYSASQPGDDLEEWLCDWMQAESEVLCPVRVAFHETNDRLQVELEVPGFSARHLELSIDPICLAISGKRSFGTGSVKLHLFRVVSLPVKVDPSRMVATFGRGVLKLSIPKEREDACTQPEPSADYYREAKQKRAAASNAPLLFA